MTDFFVLFEKPLLYLLSPLIDATNSKSLGGRLAGILLNSQTNALAADATGISQNGGKKNNPSGAGGGGGSGAIPIIPWGKVLPSKIEQTLPHFPGMQPTDGSWQIVNGTRFKFFVFSAYYDRRDGSKLLRVVGATKTRSPERVWCRFWYPQGNLSSGIGDRHAVKYSSATVMARVKVRIPKKKINKILEKKFGARDSEYP